MSAFRSIESCIALLSFNENDLVVAARDELQNMRALLSAAEGCVYRGDPAEARAFEKLRAAIAACRGGK